MAAPDSCDVLIVGAGLSGIGAAVHLARHCPEKRVVILEARASIGGTWDLFRYPGIRSDSDMYTLGYAFKPWASAKAIADGPSICDYVRQTAVDFGVDGLVRFRHRVLSADWSTTDACWHIAAETDSGRKVFSCRFLVMASGYYDYDGGYRPQWPGESDFSGAIIHPQAWPEALDYGGKRIAVIGSGATAVTLVPELAKRAEHVTMVQRSPSYVVSRPSVDFIAEWLKRWLPLGAAYALTRWKNVLLTSLFYKLARRRPERVARKLIQLARDDVGERFDAADFTPSYKPWDQRLCLVPDGDLFRSIRSGEASIATAGIERFTPEGLRLADGRTIAADVIVTATGLNIVPLGKVAVSVDGAAINPADTMVYKGMMLSDVPNLVFVFGYTNASWTLKADLTSGFLVRLLKRMDSVGARIAMAKRDPSVSVMPFLDFTSGYVQRALPDLPKQGARRPWRLYQNYWLDLIALRFGRIEDGTLALS